MPVSATHPVSLPQAESGANPPQGAQTPARLAPVPEHGRERRRSGRRARARDRLMDRATQPNRPSAALVGVDNIENLLMFVDDDLRETALSIHHIEAYLLRVLGLLEASEIRRRDVTALTGDTDILDHVDQLNETLESLRRRLARLGARMK